MDYLQDPEWHYIEARMQAEIAEAWETDEALKDLENGIQDNRPHEFVNPSNLPL